MKTTLKIARTELQALFYSPVAWLILIIFTFQCTTIFSGLMDSVVRRQYLGADMNSITLALFAGPRGLFTAVAQQYLYLYIPLLTMGVMSRETRSGSIKLLYSSPLTNTQIILGKYLALVAFGLVLLMLLAVISIFAGTVIIHTEVPVILSGLLGVFLLTCTYAAIGLFVSSLTSYGVVAAIGTLAIFALLNYARGMWQDVAFVRDITYWLAIGGRTDNFIAGFITSEHVLYFLIVIGLFLGFTILRLQSGRQHSSKWMNFSRYAAVFCVAMLLGYVSSRPSFKIYADVTRSKLNTLTISSQKVMEKMNGPLKITTYVNMLDDNFSFGIPTSYKNDVERYRQYVRFKPDIKMEYVYYYHRAKNERLDKQFPRLNDKQRLDTLSKIYNWNFNILPYSAISKQIDLSGEGYRFVRLVERANGQKTFIRVFNDAFRVPFEAENTAALKRLVMELPVVGFLKGHGERASDGENDRGYNMVAQEKTFRYSLINQGFDFTDVTLDKPIAQNIRILVIAELKTALTATEMQYMDAYIQRGGNLIIAGEPGREVQMNQLTSSLGVQFLPGTLVKPDGKQMADLMMLKPTKEAIALNHHFAAMLTNTAVLTMPSAAALTFSNDKGFNVHTLFATDPSGSWNETNTNDFISDTAIMDNGETATSHPVMLALGRKINGREQKIIVSGDADWLSNGELGRNRKDVRAGNFSASNGIFFWLSDNEVPIDMRRADPLDVSLKIDKGQWAISSLLLRWLFPIILIAAGLLIWLRRRGR